MEASFTELLLLLALGGMPVSDVASLLEPAAYLKAHGVEPKAERLAELAAGPAKDGKGQMTQLQAIRWLGGHPAEAKRAGALDALRAVAEGKEGDDAYGLARAHAAVAVARIEGKPLPAGRAPPAGGCREMLSWFPAGATLVGAADVQAVSRERPLDPDAVAALLARPAANEREMKPIYDFVNAVGDLRLDGAGFAVQRVEDKPSATRIWVRLRVAGDLGRLGDFLKTEGFERQELKGPGDAPFVLLTRKDESPAVAVVGKTDLLVAGFNGNHGDHAELVRALLEVRSGKGKSVLAGPLAEVLKAVPEDARALFVADGPESLQPILPPRGPLPAIPQRTVLEVVGGWKATTVRLRATLKDEAEAAEMAKALNQWKDQGLQALKDLPREVKIPKEALDQGRSVLEGVKVESAGTTVNATVRVPPEAIRAALKALEAYYKAEASRPSPSPR
jgi:hypothetical protein